MCNAILEFSRLIFDLLEEIFVMRILACTFLLIEVLWVFFPAGKVLSEKQEELKLKIV